MSKSKNYTYEVWLQRRYASQVERRRMERVRYEPTADDKISPPEPRKRHGATELLLRQRRAERNLEDDVEDDDDTTIRHLRLTVAVPSRQVNTSAAAASEATPVRHGHGGSVGHIAHRVSRGRRRASSAVRVRRREASGCDDASSNTSFYITFSLFLLALGVGFGWTFNHYTIDIFGRFPFFVWLYCGTLYSVPCQTFVSLYMYISLILY